MRVELFPFQKTALNDLRAKTFSAMSQYKQLHASQVVSFTAPTGSGKTIIMASLIENILYGDSSYTEHPESVFVWLSDSPQLNAQSRQKIDLKADKIQLGQCVTIQEDSFDQEYLDDGHIYFLNTQKLGKSSNLTKQGDRNYTIWETLANTVRVKGDHLYFIIDEAHRGAKPGDAGKNTTIMQKFIKGSEQDHIPPMPVVIGMSATMERFNKLVEGTTSTIFRCEVSTADVRSSGLLKDRIVILYPEAKTEGIEMSVLQAAARDWKNKLDHWERYCAEQRCEEVNPVFVIQVQSTSNGAVSDTDLDDCLKKIEEEVGLTFNPGEVVYTFGQTASSISINGLDVYYEEPSAISDNKNIKVVFFKENLSTGWDCPRAETMMSFRRAVDSTYIAQLLGRMVRTPLQMHIQSDDVLNDVHLYLPDFDKNTVQSVVDALQSTEGGEMPAEIYGQPLGEKRYDTLTVTSTSHRIIRPMAGQISIEQLSEQLDEPEPVPTEPEYSEPQRQSYQRQERANTSSRDGNGSAPSEPTPLQQTSQPRQTQPPDSGREASENARHASVRVPSPVHEGVPDDTFDRTRIVRFINDLGLLTYEVRSTQTTKYLPSLFKLGHLLVYSGLHPNATNDINNDIVGMIRDNVALLIERGEYDAAVSQVKKFDLRSQTFDVFGRNEDIRPHYDLFTLSMADEDIDRKYRNAEKQLGDDGVGNEYGRRYVDWGNPNDFKIDVILFAQSTDCMRVLNSYAQNKFHSLNDDYRRRFAQVDDERIRRQYDNIVSDGDDVSRHNFRLPETIQVPRDAGGREYSDHLFVSEETGTAKIKLNSWEEATLNAERSRPDFVCWIRNSSRAAWALTIPYDQGNNKKSAYPDFIIVRKDIDGGYIVDALEPHGQEFGDNLGKAKGFAEYARQNPGIGRIQLIRMTRDVTGVNRLKRIDMSKTETRERVARMMSQDELDHYFDEYGFYEE